MNSQPNSVLPTQDEKKPAVKKVVKKKITTPTLVVDASTSEVTEAVAHVAVEVAAITPTVEVPKVEETAAPLVLTASKNCKKTIEQMHKQYKKYLKGDNIENLTEKDLQDTIFELVKKLDALNTQAQVELRGKRSVRVPKYVETQEGGVVKVTNEANIQTGIMKPHTLVPQMYAFARANGYDWKDDDKYSRIDVDKVIINYIKTHNVNPDRKQIFAPDAELTKLFDYNAEVDGPFGYTKIKRFISRLLVKV